MNTPMKDANPPNESNERLLRVSYFDGLTGAYNRVLFSSILEEMVSRSHRSRQPFVLLDIDIDRFRVMNEAFGQRFGDQLLCEVVARIRRWLEPQEVMARIGSDEFGILLPRTEPGSGLDWRLESLLLELAQPLPGDDTHITLSASVGIACFPGDGVSASELLHHAGAALGQAKQRALRRLVHYSPEEGERARGRLLMESRLRRAIDNGILEVKFQPQVCLETGRLHGIEALARWTDPEAGTIAPDIFIRLAEETGLVEALGEQVLECVAHRATRWQSQGIAPFPIGVNLSALQFVGSRLEQTMARLLRTHTLDPAWITLELTETALLADADRTRAIMERLCAQGFRFSLDDFGTGYSSLSHLHQFPIEEIKIDRSFVSRIPGSEPHLRIIRALINLAQDLGKSVVAEGVETKEQITTLRNLGCATGQGYVFDRALAADMFEARWLQPSRIQPVEGHHHPPTIVVV